MKAEGLQHLFVALAGSHCKELWTLLVTFFSKGMGFDPFDFLDAALAIKPPLDLGDTDSDEAEEQSDAASSATLGSTSTTISTATVPAPAATASTSMQEEATMPAPNPTPALPEVEVKVSTDPTPPTPDTTGDTGEVPSELTPEQEQELLAGEESSQDTPRPPTPDDRTLLKATSFAPSNLRQWEYSSSVHSSIMSHRPKGGDLSKDLAIAMVKEDIPPEDSDDPVEPPAPKKPKSEGDGAPSM